MNNILKQIVIAVLMFEAKLTLRRFKPFMIGVTGSVGKTSTKDAVASVLAHVEGPGKVRKSQKSMNSEIGLPLTILGLENAWGSPLGWLINLIHGLFIPFTFSYPKILVLEIGADQPGDIKQLLSWLSLDIVVVTRLPDTPVHVENYANAEEVREEEWSLVFALKEGGIAILNGDDANIMALRQSVTQNVLTFGFGTLAAMRGSEPHINYTEENEHIIPEGMALTIEWKGDRQHASVHGVLGDQLLYSALAGVTVGCALGYELKDAIEGVEETIMPPGRMRVIPGKNNSILIDDSYNASPVAVAAALETLHAIKGKGRKIAMLGDMLELGDLAETEHRKIGATLPKCVDLLVSVGARALWFGDEAIKSGLDQSQVYTFTSSEEAGEWMHHHIQENDVILIKGSQGSGQNKIRMERATRELMLHPEEAIDKLVRQESEWINR